jgi:hypothetical protein
MSSPVHHEGEYGWKKEKMGGVHEAKEEVDLRSGSWFLGRVSPCQAKQTNRVHRKERPDLETFVRRSDMTAKQ